MNLTIKQIHLLKVFEEGVGVWGRNFGLRDGSPPRQEIIYEYIDSKSPLLSNKLETMLFG